MKQKNIFLSPTQGRMELTKVAKEISSYINQDSQRKYRLIVGTDSNGDKKADFVTAIIVCRVGRGGRYFWKKTNGNKTFHTIRDRIYQEVTLSLQTAQDILGELESSLKPDQQPDYDFQIHIDVGQKGP
ncbi:ribonuclease H-like YkuK family protein, partial [Patescibacteria group bacterium]|nr:ribonuclease H-like YkuK family protein [Patescibacteria group bacterium]